jgi:hypothetical protein
MAYKKLGYGKFLSMFGVTKKLNWRRQKQLCYWRLFLSHCLAEISMCIIHLAICFVYLVQNLPLTGHLIQRNGGDLYICEGFHLQ